MCATCGTDHPVAAETVEHQSCVSRTAPLQTESQLHWVQCMSCQKWRLVSAEISMMAEVHDRPPNIAASCTMHTIPHRIRCGATAVTDVSSLHS